MVMQSEADAKARRLVPQDEVFRELEEIIEDAQREQSAKKSGKTRKHVGSSLDQGRKARRQQHLPIYRAGFSRIGGECCENFAIEPQRSRVMPAAGELRQAG
jgi:hypothetical protein